MERMGPLHYAIVLLVFTRQKPVLVPDILFSS